MPVRVHVYVCLSKKKKGREKKVHVCTRDTYHVGSSAFFCTLLGASSVESHLFSCTPNPQYFFEPSHVPMNRLAGFLSVSRVWRMQSRFLFSFIFFSIKAPSGCPLLAERRKTNKIETLPSNRLATGPFLNYEPTIRGAITTPPEKVSSKLNTI